MKRKNTDPQATARSKPFRRAKAGEAKGIKKPKPKSAARINDTASESDVSAYKTEDEADEDAEDEGEREGVKDEDEDEENEPIAKKRIKENRSPQTRSKAPANLVQISKDGESYIDLGKGKRASVTTFKKYTLLNIREYYGSPGEEKPGKKGITLNLEQWQVLRDNAGDIDRLFSEMQGK